MFILDTSKAGSSPHLSVHVPFGIPTLVERPLVGDESEYLKRAAVDVQIINVLV